MEGLGLPCFRDPLGILDCIPRNKGELSETEQGPLGVEASVGVVCSFARSPGSDEFPASLGTSVDCPSVVDTAGTRCWLIATVGRPKSHMSPKLGLDVLWSLNGFPLGTGTSFPDQSQIPAAFGHFSHSTPWTTKVPATVVHASVMLQFCHE